MKRTARTQAIGWRFMGVVFGVGGLVQATFSKTWNVSTSIVLFLSLFSVGVCFYIGQRLADS
jgi:hypothetical protein